MILYVINNMLKDQALAQAGLDKLKEAFAVFANNKQKYPLVYERECPAWPSMHPVHRLTLQVPGGASSRPRRTRRAVIHGLRQHVLQ